LIQELQDHFERVSYEDSVDEIEDELVVNHALVVEEDELNHMDDHMDRVVHLPLDYNQQMLVEVDSLND
jgi:hypothetical protein